MCLCLCLCRFGAVDPIAIGGAWIKLKNHVDLTGLPTIAAVGSKRKTPACNVPVEGREIEVTFDVAIGNDTKWLVTAILGVITRYKLEAEE